MSNFSFVKQTIPHLHGDCARAESYVSSDPRSACFYSRRVAEELVDHLYDLWSLPQPYKDDLAARTNASQFKAKTGMGINKKLNLLRKVGNQAVHEHKDIRPDIAVAVLRELHHMMIWAAFNHSAAPEQVPTHATFDPALAQKAAPLSRQEVAQLAAKFQAQDKKHAEELAAKDELLAATEAQIEKLQAEVMAAQAAKTGNDDRDYSEAETRDLFIDVLLNEAGWQLDGTDDLEYEVTGMPNEHGVGYVDYVLWGSDGLPLAVVEAKRTRTSAQVGQRQAELYADCLETQFGRRPIIFYTNGYEHWVWDSAGGYPPREVQGFFTRDELELMIQRRRTRLPLAAATLNTAIVERPYQAGAIKAVGEAFDAKQREALLVMATGSGKTRTVIALAEQLMQYNWVKRVLFLADRTALVRQAANAFKAHLPNSTTVNLVTERDADGRVYVSTYPTIMNLINDVDESGRRFGPGYFDLVVIDEAHRSVYAKYGAIFEYFDSLLLGLTATPKDEVDHNTYQLFNLEDGVPTYAYGLDEAVADGYLVPPKGVSVGTKFLCQGIKYDDLSDEEKDEWDTLDWGEDDTPTEVGAGELNKFLFNEDTVDKVIATVMADGHHVAGGDRLGKTIIFAKSQAHAEYIVGRFDRAYPELAGQFARVITHASPYAQSLIDDFSVKDKAPHIAVSVDMLDTGIDVPEVLNLVFFKTVHSKSKYWQMIGRGTRLCPDLFGPDEDKQDFLVFDFCGNLEFFNQDLPTADGSIQKSLSEHLFETRLGLVGALDQADLEQELRASTAAHLRKLVNGMNLENFAVRPYRRAIEKFAEAAAWSTLSAEDHISLIELSGLPTSVRDSDEDAKRFDLLILRHQLAQLEGDTGLMERLCEKAQALADALLTKTAIPSVAKEAELLERVASDDWWVDVSLPMLELARLRLRELIRFVDKTARNPVYTDFEDVLTPSTEIQLKRVTPAVDFDRFRAKAAAYLKSNEDHVALQRLRRNRQLTGDDISSLEAMLYEAGGDQAHLTQAQSQDGGLGVFIRSLVGLDRGAAVEAFADFLDGSKYTQDQVHFVNLVVDELTANGVMEPGRIYESPYTDRAATTPHLLFSELEVNGIATVLREVKRHAVPEGVA